MRELEEKWQTRWRPRSEHKYYSNRRKIIREIENMAGEPKDYKKAVDQLENYRRDHIYSLDQLMKNLPSKIN